MQGLQPGVVLAVALAFVAGDSAAQDRGSFPPAELQPNERAIAPSAVSVELAFPRQLQSDPVRIEASGARYVKVHFSRFSIPDGVLVEVRSADGAESYYYSNSRFDQRTVDWSGGDDGIERFSALSVNGDTAVVRLLGRLDLLDPKLHAVVVDAWTEGRSYTPASPRDGKASDPGPQIETECGANERYDAICWATSNPAEYDRAEPVAVLVTSRGEECTAWRVGPDNRMFTAEHCISGQSDLDGSEIWFNYRATSCGGSSATTPVKVAGDQLLARDRTLDFSLFTVKDFGNISRFGYLGLDTRNGTLGEGIFIPQHGLGEPSQIAIESDMNGSGLCEIDDPDHYGYSPGSDLGYYCDTTTSSSGSPVISALSGKVIALHHLGGCFNSGTKIALIWPQVSSYFGGKVPSDDRAPWQAGNVPPSARFTADCRDLSCTFDASSSSDSDGSIADFSWSISDGGSANGGTVNYVFAAGGSFDVTLSVQDDGGAFDSVVKTVSVAAANASPKASFSIQCTDNDCSFDGSGSSDPDGAIAAWDWDFGDGGTASGSAASYQFAAAGSHTITLTVADDRGDSDSRSQTITVTLPNVGPVASFSYQCTNYDCSFDGSGSSDPDGSIVDYRWDFGDGSTANGRQAIHNFSADGSYRIELTVVDDAGAAVTSSQTVEIAAPEPPPDQPVARFSVDCEERKCTMDAGSSTDSNGAIARYDWEFGDGTTGEGRTISHDYAADGAYRVTLKVTDGLQLSDSRTRQIEIESRRDIVLNVNAHSSGGRTTAVLTWSGIETAKSVIIRDGKIIAETDNSGEYVDMKLPGIGKPSNYQVCDASRDYCSAKVAVQFATPDPDDNQVEGSLPGKERL